MPPSNARSATPDASSAASARRSRAATGGWAALACAAALLAGGCGAQRIVLPQGPGAPLSDFRELFDAATAACRGVRTLELVLAIEGEAGGARLRGRVRGALARPAALRLEGMAPFGAPAFILVAGAAPAVLLLPRERRVVTDASGRDLLERLAGLPLAPADLRAVLTGCLVPQPTPVAARTYANGWVGVELEGAATLFVDPAGDAPVVVAGRRPGLVVAWDHHVRGLPRRIQARTAPPGDSAARVTAALSQVSINVEIPAQAFAPVVPEHFIPTSIDALRPGAGPLAAAEP